MIYHNKYKRKDFTYTQLVWLKLDCPFDGSIRGLCYNFFQTIDNLLGTNYFEEYAKNAKNVDQMIPNMALVAANHCVGVLVIDEIQRLSKAKSGGAEAMLDFFVQLVNTIGIPVVLVGTYKALPILSGAISQMRRGTGQGDLIWDRMKYDDQWNLLMEDLWDYQYIQNKRPFEESSELSKVIYEETQGITDLAIKLFMFAQERAITSKVEELNSSIIRSAAIDKFNLLQPALKAFKDKDKEALSNFEDAYPEFLKVTLFEEENDQMDISGAVTEEPEIKILFRTETNNLEQSLTGDQLCLETQMAVEDFFYAKTSKPTKSHRKEVKGILPSIFRSVTTPDSENVYNAMKNAGYIKSGNEFLNCIED